MKVLWVINIVLPTIAKDFDLPVAAGGGWLLQTSDFLSKSKEIELVISFPQSKSKYLVSKTINGVTYYGFPTRYKNHFLESFNEIYSSERPDLIHIWGTEYPHSHYAVMAAPDISKVVVSIQGLLSVYAKHSYSNIPPFIVAQSTLRDLIRLDNIYLRMKKYERQGKLEVLTLSKVQNVIGRTDWDYASVKLINSITKYYHCNENMRYKFYESIWTLTNCEPYSIFTTQYDNPIKGFHNSIKSFLLVLQNFPSARLYTTGENVFTVKWYKKTTYQKYIQGLIKKNKIQDKVVFLGNLNEEEMISRYIKSNVFLLSSSIENSPNVVGEAMLLGVPVVVSNVGGVSNLLSHGVEGYLFQHNAPYMSAHYICNVFNSKEIAVVFSDNSRKKASTTHNATVNNKVMCKIYERITSIPLENN